MFAIKKCIYIAIILFVTVINSNIASARSSQTIIKRSTDTLIVELGIVNERISRHWRNAIETRISKEKLDSISRLTRPLTEQEKGWQKLIESKSDTWNKFKDSLTIPFGIR